MKTNIQPHVGAMAYTVLAGTLYVGRIVNQQDKNLWELLAFSVHPEDADAEDAKLDRLGFIRHRLAIRTDNLNVHCACAETVPAELDRHNATVIVVTAFDEELARVNIPDSGYGYNFALKSACAIRNQFNKDWMRKIERDIVRAYYTKSSNSNEASEE